MFSTTDVQQQESPGRDIARGVLALLWHAFRIPVLAALIILEVPIRIALTCTSAVGLLVTFVFELSGAAPGFPFWRMLGLSIGAALLRVLYEFLLQILER